MNSVWSHSPEVLANPFNMLITQNAGVVRNPQETNIPISAPTERGVVSDRSVNHLE